MSTAIWLLDYGVSDESLDTYLGWFHRVHLPDKLARPGYTWAAHYRVREPHPKATCPRYLALFGGETPRVFLDPSPAQLKLRQSAETRAMMDLRIDGRSTVYCEEWGSRSGGTATPSQRGIVSPVLRFESWNAHGHDEDLAAWCAQEHVPYFTADGRCIASRKLIASAGGPRHAIAQEFNDAETARYLAANEPSTEWRRRVAAAVSQPLGAALIAERIWPV